MSRHSTTLVRSPYQRKYFAVTLWCTAALLTLSGCVSNPVTFYPLDNSPASTPAPVDPSQVKVYITQRPENYTELGMLTYGTNTWVPDEATVYEEFRKKAAALGANGVLLLPPSEKYEYTPAYYGLKRYDRTEMTRTTFRGVAILTED